MKSFTPLIQQRQRRHYTVLAVLVLCIAAAVFVFTGAMSASIALLGDAADSLSLYSVSYTHLTPGVAYLVRKYHADAGIMISASHNPMEFNGIKIFKGDGYKLPDEVENQIEAHVFNNCTDIRLAEGADIGRIKMCRTGVKDYVDFLQEHIDADLTGLKVLFDCANGASARVAQELFPRLGCECGFIGTQQDGVSVNDGCGSTHLETLEAAVKQGGYDCGIAFDGDADRCLACDENGAEIDGDKIIALVGTDMKERGRLDGNTVVVTVMSNLGLSLIHI